MIDELLTDSKENDRGLIEVISKNFPEGTEVNYENL